METVVMGIIVVLTAWYIVWKFLSNSSCNNDCNQGRNCNCK